MKFCLSPGLFLLMLALLLSGCGSGIKEYNVTLSKPTYSDFLVNNVSFGNMSLTIVNHERLTLHCSIIIRTDNGTNSTEYEKDVGGVWPGTGKNLSAQFRMLEGNSSLRVKPICSRLS